MLSSFGSLSCFQSEDPSCSAESRTFDFGVRSSCFSYVAGYCGGMMKVWSNSFSWFPEKKDFAGFAWPYFFFYVLIDQVKHEFPETRSSLLQHLGVNIVHVRSFVAVESCLIALFISCLPRGSLHQCVSSPACFECCSISSLSESVEVLSKLGFVKCFPMNKISLRYWFFSQFPKIAWLDIQWSNALAYICFMNFAHLLS